MYVCVWVGHFQCSCPFHFIRRSETRCISISSSGSGSNNNITISSSGEKKIDDSVDNSFKILKKK